jgi:Bacterial TSP3 repeat
MTLTTTARRGSAIIASLATTSLLTLASSGAVHATGTRDSDHDGMPNRWEIRHNLNPHKANAHGDPDQDGLSNLGEFRHGTAPHQSDSDGDGIEDGPEVHDGCTATDPTESDSDGDGIEDGQEDTDGDGIDDAQDNNEDNCQGDDDMPGSGDGSGSGSDRVVLQYVVAR